MDTRTNKSSKIINILGTILVPLVLMALVFKIMNVAPFGANNFLVSDLQAQYFPFFSELRRELLNHTISSYSFLVSIGDSIVPIYTYYLMSPLNLIIVLFKQSQVPIAIDLIIWIKIVLASISMSTFLNLKYKKYNLMSIAGGVAYGLCGFVAMYYYDLMWLDALIVLPFIVLGLERLFYKNKVWLYVFTLTYTIFTNYYMGYMICVFCVIYFLYLLKKEQAAGMKFLAVFRDYISSFWRFAWYSIIAGLLSAVLLLPTIFSMLSTGKGSFDVNAYMPYLTFGTAFGVNLGVGANNFLGRLNHDPSIFTGSLFIIGFIAYLISKKINKTDKRASMWLTGLIFAGIIILPLNTIWHMFQQPAGFPFRMVYLFSFSIIMVTYEGYLEGLFEDKKSIIISSGIVAALIALGYLTANIVTKKFPSSEQLFVTNEHLLYVAAFIILTVLLMILSGKKVKFMSSLLLLLLAAEMGTNFIMSSREITWVNQKYFASQFNKANALTKEANRDLNKQNVFYRAIITNYAFKWAYAPNPYNEYNDSLIFNTPSLGSYSSTLNSNTQFVLSNLGFGSRNVRRIGTLGSTPITNNLFDIKYIANLSEDGNQIEDTNAGAGLGIMANNQVQKLKLKPNHIIGNLNNLAKAQTGAKKGFMKKSEVFDLKEVQNKYYFYDMQVKAKANGPQFMYVPRVVLSNLRIRINGQRLPGRYQGLSTSIIPLGNAKKGQITKVHIASVYKLEGKQIKKYFATLKMKKYQKYINYTKKHHLALDNAKALSKDGSKFTGTVNVRDGENTLVLGIPYDKSWQVKVDGKKAKTLKVVDGLTGVQLTSGKHRLAFNYQVHGLMLGSLLTCLGLILVGGSMIVRIRRKQ